MPFRYAIDKATDAIMIGHLVYPKIDGSGKPATRSEVFLKEILRKELDLKVCQYPMILKCLVLPVEQNLLKMQL